MKKKVISALLAVLLICTALIIINPLKKQEYSLSNPDADENASKLFSYIVSVQEKSVFVGSAGVNLDGLPLL